MTYNVDAGGRAVARGLSLADALKVHALVTCSKVSETSREFSYASTGTHGVYDWSTDIRMAQGLTLDAAIVRRNQLAARDGHVVVIVPDSEGDERLCETDDSLISAIRERLPEYEVGTLHTGGGCMVGRVVLWRDKADEYATQEIWFTREDDWFIGLYNFAHDECDEGVTIEVPYKGNDADKENPVWVAMMITNIVKRVRVNA